MSKPKLNPLENRKPIAIISNDWHLKVGNVEQIKKLVEQKCKYAVENEIKYAFVLGDLFETRAGQKVDELVSLDEILDIFEKYKIELWAIPGNHDKQNYSGYKSFLHPYRHHPYFKYIDRAGGVPIGDIVFHLLPYFKESVWVEKYKELVEYIGEFEKGTKHILLSHQAVNGSVNNDGTKVECGISVTDFSKWHLVLLGHYHNQQQVGANVFHLPSIQQNNFGEDSDKGFTVVRADGTFDLIQSKFTIFEKVVIECDKVNKKMLAELVKHYSSTGNNVRFEFIGSSDEVKKINKEELNSFGIDVKIKVKEIEDTIQYAEEEVKEYNKESIVEEFKVFCKERDRDYDQGMIYLTKKLEKCQ